jgi:hypothetical protein
MPLNKEPYKAPNKDKIIKKAQSERLIGLGLFKENMITISKYGNKKIKTLKNGKRA